MTVSVNTSVANGLNTRLSETVIGSIYGNIGTGEQPPMPTLVLDFSQPLPSSITFTRADAATCATYFDKNGVLRTAAANIPRIDYDPATGVCKGLLSEESRTNLLLNSLADGTSLSTQSVTVTAAAHTLSFYGTGTVTLSGTSTAGPLIGTSATTKSTLTFTPTAGSLTLTVSGTVKWANLELGNFSTSHIATAGTTRTRAADAANMTSTNFSSWYNQTEGTFVCSYSRYSVTAAGNQIPILIGDGTSSNIIAITDAANGTSDRLIMTTLGVSQISTGSVNYSASQPMVRSFAYKLNDSGTSVNGAVTVTDTVCTPPTVNRLDIGYASYFLSSRVNGHIRQITYYPKRLSATLLQALTR